MTLPGIEPIATFLGGLGLFFTGIRNLSANMLQIGGKRLREAATDHTGSPVINALIGTLAGALLQSSNGIAFVLISMVTAGLVPVATAMSLMLWANLGTSTLVILASIDLRLVALVMLGIAGVWLHIDRAGSSGRRRAIEVLMSIAMLFFGLELLRAGTADVHSGEAAEAMRLAGASAMGAFVLGVVGTLITQSSASTTIIAVAASQAGLFSFNDAVLLVLGASIGSGSNVLLLGARARGTQKQLVLFQGLAKLLGIAVILPLVLLELSFGWPLLLHAVRAMASDPGRQLTLVYVACQAAPLVIVGVFSRPIRQMLARIAPPLAAESLRQPQFIYDGALGDADIALILVEKEQARVVARLAGALETPEEAEAASLTSLTAAIGRFLGAIAGAGEGSAVALPQEQLDRIANLQARNEVVRLLHENVQQFAHERDALPPGAVAKLADTLTQGLSAVLMCLDDAVRDGAAEDIALVRQISSDRSTVVDSLRRQLVQAGSQELVYSLTSLFERAVWLVQRYSLLLREGAAAT